MPISSAALLEHIRVLSSDEFEGRAPGSRGEELSIQYLTEQCRKIGLEPGNPDGSFVQEVPLIGFASKPTASLDAGGRAIELQFPNDFVAISRHFQERVDVDRSDIVFVGYGVVAPEFGWDDYKDVDVRGKTLLMLINDPGFKGRAMTYYGRWTYKYEIASAKGAAAAIIIHETGPAGYPFEVVKESWGRENFDIAGGGAGAGADAGNSTGAGRRVRVESWVSLEKANELLGACGYTYEQLKAQALRKDFRPVALHAAASFHLTASLRSVTSHNVIAKLRGRKQPDEYVVYTAHWDHLGRDPDREGDPVFHGAIDNSSGCAALLELAREFAALPQRPDRSILFLFTTSEEQGLLGAKYYGTHPLYPLNKTLADINIDGLNAWGPTRDIVVIGYGNSTLDDLMENAASHKGRVIVQDPEPEKGFFYRADHFEFAKQGVPALYVEVGIDYIGKPEGWGKQKRDEFTTNDYHKPSDTVKPDWDLSGAVEDLRLLFEVGYSIAQSAKWPEWKTGTEFKALREASLK